MAGTDYITSHEAISAIGLTTVELLQCINRKTDRCLTVLARTMKKHT